MESILLKAVIPIASAEGGHSGPSFFGLVFYIGLALLVLFGLMVFAKKGFNRRVFSNAPARWFEHLYLFIQNLCIGIIGERGKKYVPMMFVLWSVIFVSNLISLFFPTAPTADLGFNLGMALIAVGYVQYEGIRQNGIIGHFAHFAGPKLGLPMIVISLMIFVIEIISEVMKNVSLSLRLFGNINGGHAAVDAMNHLGEGIYVPIGAFLLPIKLLTCLVQALIFTLLTCVYISLVTHDEHHHEEGHENQPYPAPAQ